MIKRYDDSLPELTTNISAETSWHLISSYMDGENLIKVYKPAYAAAPMNVFTAKPKSNKGAKSSV